MAKAIKLQDDNYLDSNGVVHNRVPLNEILDDVYSTQEIKTNKIWVNGKPIYRKVLIQKWENTNLENLQIDTIVNMYGTVSYINGVHSLNAYANSNFYSLLQYNSSEKVLYFYGNGYNKANDVKVILEYTKTTD